MILTHRQALLYAIAADIPEYMHWAAPIRESLLPPILRGYQHDLLSKAAALMRQGYRRILIQLATGGGKTKMACAIHQGAMKLGLRSQFIVHRRELLKQTSAEFTSSGLAHGFIASGYPITLDAPVTLAGVQTLVRRLDIVLPPNLAIIDECHHATAASWANVLDAYGDAFIIGLSATPERLDGRGLDEHFDVMIEGPSVAWLIEHGYLSRFDFYAPDTPDMSGVPSQAGDFAINATAEVVDKPAIVGSIVDHYLRLASGEQGIVFAVNREHSRHIAEEFNGRGVPAMHVDGEMSQGERDDFDDRFRAGDLRIGVNVGLFDEGYDVPGISYVGDGAPSRSVVKVRQRWGRGLRMSPGKSRAILSDHAGNAMRLRDFPDLDRKWSLEGRAKRGSGVNDDADPVRQCLSCYRIFPSVLKICPGCGHQGEPTAREIELREGELQRLDRERLLAEKQAKKEESLADRERRLAEKQATSLARKAEEKACTCYAEFHDLAVARGYKNPTGWARMRADLKQNYRGSWR